MSSVDPLTWSILLLVLGCGLVILEVFIPSGGVIGFFSGIAFIASIVMAFRTDTTAGLVFTALSMVVAPAMIGLALKVWPYTPMGKAFLGELKTSEELRPLDTRRELVGKIGVAKSKMLPSGSVQVDGKYIDAISQGAPIDLGQAIVVIEVRANRVVVRPADDEEAKQLVKDPRDVFTTPIDQLGLDSFDEPLS